MDRTLRLLNRSWSMVLRRSFLIFKISDETTVTEIIKNKNLTQCKHLENYTLFKLRLNCFRARKLWRRSLSSTMSSTIGRQSPAAIAYYRRQCIQRIIKT